ncbi:hypothetical protein JQ604_01020 [Bradyrhizobium jicamae]|uniref:hypothetical protein n=1 Tax=Bradyrhizobium jicamae TaxID=280332 RepID=UPI001BAE2EC2|nr:hypothetical protein [Bradyrhizobium jicamae]MBR0750760.1 hypothetical protein [Bradyrhizobium jicamae]
MSGLTRRLTVGLVGQGLWRVAVALNAVLLVPVLIAKWGVELYGQWMTMAALVSYLAYANLGLVATASNDLIMAGGAQDLARAQRSFQMSYNLALLPFPAILAALVGIAALLPFGGWLNLTDIPHSSLLLILGLGALQLTFETLRGFTAAVLYCTGSYGIAYNIAAGAKLIELASAILAVGVLGAGPVQLAALGAAVAFLDLSVVTWQARKAAPWARLDLRAWDWRWLRDQMKPALGFSCYNFATQGVLLQGPRLVLGAFLGGSAVAIYAVYATAMRLVDQLFLSLMAPVGVEISHAAGRGDSGQVLRLLAVVTQLSLLALLCVTLLLLGLGPIIFDIWTHQRIEFLHGLMALYLLMSAASLPGRIAAQVLISVNAMRSIAVATLAIALAAITLAAGLVQSFGLPGVLIGGIIGDAAISILVIVALNRWLGLSFNRLAREIGNIRASATQVLAHARVLLGRQEGRT